MQPLTRYDEAHIPAPRSSAPGAMRPRLLMAAFYCSPSRGSDWRVGWGRAVQAARLFDTIVLTSEASRPDIEAYIEQAGVIDGLRFEYISDAGKGPLARLPKSFLYINPFAYSQWQDRAWKRAQQLHAEKPFDATHQVNLIGYREPGMLYRLGVPSLWGPIGGMQNYPTRFIPGAGLKDGCKELIRTTLNNLQLRYSRKVRRAIAGNSFIFAANSDAQRAIRRFHGRDVPLLLETGLEKVSPTRSRRMRTGPLRILWSGELRAHKALCLLLEALGAARGTLRFELRVLGAGPLKRKLEKAAERLLIPEHCHFAGFLPLEEAMNQSDWADVFVFTSLRDTSGNVMLEAMSKGAPVICLDHQGAADIVTPESGIKIPVSSRASVVHGIKDALCRLDADRQLLAELSGGAVRRAMQYLWDENAKTVAEAYRRAVQFSVNRSRDAAPYAESAVTRTSSPAAA